MVTAKLDEISKATRIRLWHHSTLQLFKYLSFEPL